MRAVDSGDFESQRAILERKIRARGAVLDLKFAQSLYKPLLDTQSREGVEVLKDLAYGPDPRHRLDVYRPEVKSAAPRPAIVFLPGGGFIRGDKADRENVGQFFARQGFVVAVVNYRLAPTHHWPAGALDASAGFSWLRERASDLNIDPEAMYFIGESAGAAHVAAATLVRRFHPSGGASQAGTVLISGPYNPVLEKEAREQFGVATPDPRNEAYFGADFSRYKEMSTIALIDAAPSSRLLITFAELDLLQMQVQASELFARLVTEHGYQPQLRVIRGHNHLTQVYAINTGDEALSSPILEFLRSGR